MYKRISIFITFTILCYNVLLQSPYASESDKTSLELKTRQLALLQSARDNNPQKCEEAISALFEIIPDILTKENEIACSSTISSACNILDNLSRHSENRNTKTYYKLATFYSEKFLQMNFNEVQAINNQWFILKSLLSDDLIRKSKDIDILDVFRKQRKWQTQKAIQIWNQLETHADRTWSIENYTNELRPLSDISPFYAMDISQIPDSKERKKCIDYIERKNILIRRSVNQFKAIELQKQIQDEFIRILVSYYTTAPYDKQEIEKLLETLKDSSNISERILESIKKQAAWIEAGFREWLTKDGLFKPTAKFISLDKKDVKLEKEDGKQITIELSALRKEDQDYVKRQIESETKNPKDEKPKN